MSPPADVTLRPMTLDDVDAGLRLCRAARWNQVARDWEQFLGRQPGGALVACRGPRVVGSVATLRYAPDLAWVAMVLVDPEERGRGIGRSLLLGGLALVDDVACVGLDATPLGRPLYLSLGFHDAAALTRFQRADPALAHGAAREFRPLSSAPTLDVRPLDARDLDEVATLDRRTTGVDRASMLTWLAEGAARYAWVAREGAAGPLAGFICGREGHEFEHLGPVVAETPDVAGALVSAALGGVPSGRPVVVDAASDRPAWPAWLESVGFVAQRPFTRMYRGPSRVASPQTYAIIGPEFG